MNSLNHLGNVVKRMKKHELQTLNAYLNAFKIDKIYKDSKSASLIELLADSKQPNIADVLQFKIYGKANPKAFQKLVDRTKDKVYESLLLENNIKRLREHPVRNRVGYDLRKRLVEAEILSSRGLSEDLELLYDKMLKKALLFEFYDIALEVLLVKHTFSAFRYGIKKIDKIAKEIIRIENIRSALIRSRIMYDKFVARVNFSASPQDYIDELPMMIEKLRQDYELTNSPSIGYYLYFIETELYQQLNNFEQAKTTLLSMVELLKDNASVRTKNRLSIVYGNLANNELLLHQFEKGIKYATIAGDYSKESQVNLNVIREVEFFLQLFQGKLDLAEQLIVELYQSSAKQKASFLFYKRTYLYACLKNLQGDYKRSEELLGEVKEIEKDKEGWNIGIRLLQIMNLIDRGKHDLIETNVQNLKKYLGRLKGQSQARKRYAVILRILTRLMNDNYYFRKTFKRSAKYFDLLHSTDDRFAWSVKGPEVVAFHEWFESRMEMRKFSYAQIFKVD